MKKILCVALLIFLLGGVVFAEKRRRLLNETLGAINVTANQVTVPDNGYLAITAVDAKIWVSWLGTTNNITLYMPIVANEKVDIQTFFYTSEKIAIASDSGTANYLLQVYSNPLI